MTAETAVRSLISCQVEIDDASPLAGDAAAALRDAALLLHEHGVLDILITFAAHEMTRG